MNLSFQPLGNHDRAAFSCGENSIDDFLKRYAAQRRQRHIGVPIVAVDADTDPQQIVGYYFMLPHEFRGTELSDPLRKGTRVGHLSAVPAAMLAQLGVSLAFQGKGIGKILVRHALQRACSIADTWGCVAVITDPLNERARELYTGFDFVPIRDGTQRMIVPIKTLISAFKAENAGR